MWSGHEILNAFNSWAFGAQWLFSDSQNSVCHSVALSDLVFFSVDCHLGV